MAITAAESKVLLETEERILELKNSNREVTSPAACKYVTAERALDKVSLVFRLCLATVRNERSGNSAQ
jgi:hypothetical protein